jgi:DNA-binding SARP family transcriptional activator
MSTREASIYRPLTTPPADSNAGTPRAAVLCLGAASVTLTSDNAPPRVVLTLGKPLALLSYLLLSPNQAASRERLADLLWGDQERTAARHSLRRALTYLRSHVGPWVVGGDDTSCVASPDADLDVQMFRAAVERGEYGRALGYYRGDFLADFASPGAREFESWAAIERAHLRSLAMRAGEAASKQLLDSARFTDAKAVAVKMRQIDPNSELPWRIGIEALMAAGDRLAAVAEAVRFNAWLDAEEREPETASANILKAATTAARPTAPRPDQKITLMPEFVGREREFALIVREWQAAREGAVRFVAISGAAGLGKTRLLEAVADRIGSKRGRVLSLRVFAGERGIPLSLLGALAFEASQLPGAAGVDGRVRRQLAALDVRLAGQFNVEPELGAMSDTGASVVAIRELLSAVADDAPTAVLFDDLHWADSASLRVLDAVFARLRSGPILIVTTTRSPTNELMVDERTSQIRLEPFTERDVDSFISSLGTLPPNEEWPAFLLTRVAAASRGIPLLVVNSLEQLVADKTLALRDGAWHVDDLRQFRDRVRNIDALATRIRALSSPAYNLLLRCALAGLPLPRRFVDTSSSGSPSASNTDALVELERLGFLRVSADEVNVVHDAIGETALAVATDADQVSASRELGVALAAANEPPWDEHAVRHLANAGEFRAIGNGMTAIMRRRMKASHMTPRNIAAVVLARDANDPLVTEAVRRLSIGIRIRPYRRAILALMAVPLVAIAAIAALRFSEREPDAGIEIVSMNGNLATRRARVALDRVGWDPATLLRPRVRSAGSDTLPPVHDGDLLVPGTDSWVRELESSDSGGVDVAVTSRSGAVSRLTWSPADETPAAWSPDGRLLAIRTSQFSGKGHKTLGLLDVRTHLVRSIGGIDDQAETTAAWSPDGTRIAYDIGNADASVARICIIHVDGTGRVCYATSSPNASVRGWTNGEKVIVQAGTTLFELDLLRGQFVPIDIGSVTRSDVSPDGRWLFYGRDGHDGRELFVAPSDDPSRGRRVEVDRPLTETDLFAWRGRFARREFLDTIRVVSPHDSLRVGVPFMLQATGTSNEGNRAAIDIIGWKVAAGPATIDSSGVLLPTDTGRITVEVSAGGWRTTRRIFVAIRDTPSVVLDERWTPDYTSRWTRFGHPFPKIVADSLIGPSFLNNGDGYFFSGAYVSRVFDARDGLAMDVVVRLPVTRPIEQYVALGFATGSRLSEAHTRWNHVTGYPTVILTDPTCSMAYPEHEGLSGRLFASSLGELRRPPGAPLPDLARGIPTKVRLQIFPDGRCGIAMEGQRPWISRTPAFPVDSMTVYIEGNSVGTRMLVGEVVVRKGVPGGVDWGSAAPRK